MRLSLAENGRLRQYDGERVHPAGESTSSPAHLLFQSRTTWSTQQLATSTESPLGEPDLVHWRAQYCISTEISPPARPSNRLLTVGFCSTREHRQRTKVRQIAGQILVRQMSSSRPWWNRYSPTSRRCVSDDSVNTCWWPPPTARSVPLGRVCTREVAGDCTVPLRTWGLGEFWSPGFCARRNDEATSTTIRLDVCALYYG